MTIFFMGDMAIRPRFPLLVPLGFGNGEYLGRLENMFAEVCLPFVVVLSCFLLLVLKETELGVLCWFSFQSSW